MKATWPTTPTRVGFKEGDKWGGGTKKRKEAEGAGSCPRWTGVNPPCGIFSHCGKPLACRGPLFADVVCLAAGPVLFFRDVN